MERRLKSPSFGKKFSTLTHGKSSDGTTTSNMTSRLMNIAIQPAKTLKDTTLKRVRRKSLPGPEVSNASMSDFLKAADRQAALVSANSLSYNWWFIGDVVIGMGVHSVPATMLARVDKCGNLEYSLTYVNRKGELVPLGVPCVSGVYCLNFADYNEARFGNIRHLLAHLLENNVLKMVDFLWLIDFLCDTGT